jgi:maltose alpha-D-glucosyltransferase/alpha-amylase
MIAAYVKDRRWFRAKARGLVSAAVDESFPLRLDGEDVAFSVVVCAYADGGSDRYVLPIATASGDEAANIVREQPHLVIERTSDGIRYDALGSVRLLAALSRLFDGEGTRVTSDKGTLVFRPFPGLAAARASSDVTPKPTQTEQTNSSIVFGDAFILKILRKLDPGRSAELEMGEYLTRHRYPSAPEVLGAIEIERGFEEPATVGVLHRFVASQGEAWTSTLKEIAASPSPDAYASRAALLGKRVGEMHVTLAEGTEPAFLVEQIGRDERARLAGDLVAAARGVGAQLREGDLGAIARRADAFVAAAEDPPKMRVHGDLHLGQILVTKDDFVFIDFEGEPARSLAERKAKRSPLADVAGMLRSFDYAAATALRETAGADAARAWHRAISAAFVGAYRDAIRGCSALATSDALFDAALGFFLVEKCLYEVAYEANNRPDWLAIPRDGLYDLLDA